MLRLAWAAPLLLACGSLPCFAGAPAPLAARTVALPDARLSLADALAALEKQTGNRIIDTRAVKTNPTVRFSEKTGTFWPLLDEIGKQSGTGFTPYATDEAVTLTDAPYRAVPTTYSGLFRLALRRVGVTNDLETGARHVRVGLDVAWEPRFRPFYLDPGTVAVRYAPDAAGKELQARASQEGQMCVAGRSAAEIDLRLPAPERTSPRLALLEGALSVIGPTRMLEFTFPELAVIKKGAEPRRATEDGVTVSLTQVAAGREVWTIDVLIENPPGGASLDSFQSWLDNNTIALVRGDTGSKVAWTPSAVERHELGQVTARRAHIRYYFPLEGRRLGPGDLAAWSLRYRTPARIVQVAVPFQFIDVPLP